MKLKYKNGEKEIVYELGDGMIIGRILDKCNIILTDLTVSRVHARIIREEDRYYIENLNSSNGTFVNDEQVEKAEIKSGDIIGMGRIELKVIE